MAENPILKKMKLKPGARAAVIGARRLPEETQAAARQGLDQREAPGRFRLDQLFVHSEAELKKAVPGTVRALRPDGLLWISFPKGTSKIQTDLTRDKGWDLLKGYDFKWILISVDDTWSAFALRPYRPGEARQSFR